MMRRKLLINLLIACGVTSLCHAQRAPEKLSTMSVEDLLNIQVTSVSKTEQKLSQTASAIYVITQEDIQRSGATRIPDLLRMVPGMDVGQINANTWAISARGFNGRYTDGLQVLLDGRSIYLPSFGGAYWDVFDLPLENIERIEIIRGPGGSIWGANAVNGVINIITRKAGQTKGAIVVAGGGNLDQAFGTLQYGGSIGKSTDYRVYVKHFMNDQLRARQGGDGGDGWHLARGGFRADTAISHSDQLTFQGDAYTGREDQKAKFLPSLNSQLFLTDRGIDLSGGFFQAIWKHEFSGRSASMLEFSYDGYHRSNIIREADRILNLDFQHQYRWKDRQNLVWGISVRDAAITTIPSLAVSFTPADTTLRLFAAFAQDEIAIAPNRLYLTIGARVEHEYYNGFGLMPTARAAWIVSHRNTIWAAVSRALRTPDLNETALRLNLGGFPGPGGTLLAPALLANPDLLNESLIAYELGYRSILSPKLSLDFASYYDHHSREQTSELGAPFFESQPAPAHIVLPIIYQNLMHGEAHGIEAFGNWKVLDRWTLSPGYAFQRIHMHLDPGSHDVGSVSDAEGSTPVNSLQLRSHFALFRGIAWDLSAYFVGRIADPAAPSYTRLDTGLNWQAGEKLSLSVFGQNLLHEERLEYVDPIGSTASTLVKRGAYAKVRWMF